ncbi:MAG TPA: carbamoyltransferase HypF [Thermoanaerobacterales bacterium]|nr:carbamoyltransferase HypF [Thermoanaerobacterales bacterium]
MEPLASRHISGPAESKAIKRRTITVRGIVQGVGFRPFVFTEAEKLNLKGFVTNNTTGVHIDVEGSEKNIEAFIKKIVHDPPPLSRIDDVIIEEKPLKGYTDFEIKVSEREGAGFIPVSPDMAVCRDCLKEMLDPQDRRFHYPFINCTNCGPRFSIIEDIPYDRSNTSMKDFPMCQQCEAEYKNPGDRRFHAQPVACPACGPTVFFAGSIENTDLQHEEYYKGERFEEKEIQKAIFILKTGGILAIKGLGGFHLAVNALDETAVERLRQRKFRYGKPLAVMMKDIDEVKKYCFISRQEAEILESRRAPILLLKKTDCFDGKDQQSKVMNSMEYSCDTGNGEMRNAKNRSLAESIAPGLDSVGVMLPYTPLHHLLMEKLPFPLVMTSGNVSDEPICRDNDEAMERLKGIADGLLLHDRRIVNRIDDSVVFFAAGKERLARRARGYAPEPIILRKKVKPLLACGAFYKNTFCLAKDEYAFLSQHIGDLDNNMTFLHYRQQIERYERLFKVNPLLAVRDLHPGYLSSQFAESLQLPVLAVQHHHAHIASVMAEYGLKERVLGIAYDGTGLGTDGHIWGAEFLLADLKHFQRVGHLKYVPLPGGDTAVRKPFRSALGFVNPYLEDFREYTSRLDKKTVHIISQQIKKGLNSPLVSSMGRFFDAAASLLGICDVASYEGQAAMELESMIRPDDGNYEFKIMSTGSSFIIDVFRTLKDLYMDYLGGTERGVVAARFHNTVVRFTAELAGRLRDIYKVNRVVLCGGCFQNRYLLERLNEELSKAGFEVFIPSAVPINDGGISLGQAAIAAEYFSKT